MPPKRKATSSVRGSTKSNKDSAASTPGPATPRSNVSSDDEYQDGTIDDLDQQGLEATEDEKANISGAQ
ncbi:hypothetical protein EYC84_011517 [Monilinia fructicola]|uniref:Uncharacterized protein n=1 Tax=Monilinia fructicola TaxID=38448 RepID=A0A5M9J8I9_MONFR|nr:hypothetical protein EYC84_011517 [Monilinia fructicola]